MDRHLAFPFVRFLSFEETDKLLESLMSHVGDALESVVGATDEIAEIIITRRMRRVHLVDESLQILLDASLEQLSRNLLISTLNQLIRNLSWVTVPDVRVSNVSLIVEGVGREVLMDQRYGTSRSLMLLLVHLGDVREV